MRSLELSSRRSQVAGSRGSLQVEVRWVFVLSVNSGKSCFNDVNSNYRTYANNVFGLLEANRVPTGLLLDYAFDFTEPKTFNGITLHNNLRAVNANTFTI